MVEWSSYTYSHGKLLEVGIVQEGFDVVHSEPHQQVQGDDGQEDEEDDKHWTALQNYNLQAKHRNVA